MRLALAFALAAAAVAAAQECLVLPATAARNNTLFETPRDVAFHRTAYETLWYVGYLEEEGGGGAVFGIMLAEASGGPQSASNGSCPLARLGASMVGVSDVRANEFHQQAALAIADSAYEPAVKMQAGLWEAAQSGSSWRALELSAKWGSGSARLDTTADGPLLEMARNGVASLGAYGVAHLAQASIAASGELTLGNVTRQVSGRLWSQHMYGTSPTPGSRPPAMTWHWFYVRLSDGWSLQLTMFDPTPGAPASYMNLVPPGTVGPTTVLAEQAEYGWTVEGSRPWTSPTTGRLYNTTNRIACARLGLDIVVTTRILDNEVRLVPALGLYEGLSSVEGTHLGARVTGDAYTERTLPPKSARRR